MSEQTHIVSQSEDKIRIDKLLVDIHPDYSRTQIQNWINTGLVSVNGGHVKGNYKCHTDDVVKWSVPETESLIIKAEDIQIDVIYEDQDLLVVNKPKGMVVHPSHGHPDGTLVNALLYRYKSLSMVNGEERPGIVHRLDKDTSGLLIVAKNDKTHLAIAEQLSNQKIERIYEAIVHGVIEHEKGMIDAPIGRDPKDRQKMGVVDNGKKAITHFTVINRYQHYTHVQCQLETGRTHQIRVHMKYIGHQVVGDPKYGPRKTLHTNGQALHAKRIGFIHPTTNEWMQFEVAVPNYFKEVLNNIENFY